MPCGFSASRRQNRSGKCSGEPAAAAASSPPAPYAKHEERLRKFVFFPFFLDNPFISIILISEMRLRKQNERNDRPFVPRGIFFYKDNANIRARPGNGGELAVLLIGDAG